jgi:hypothetical protein
MKYGHVSFGDLDGIGTQLAEPDTAAGHEDGVQAGHG